MKTQTNLSNNEANIRRIADAPDSELGEDGLAIIFDISNDIKYDEFEIECVEWTGREIFIWYQTEDEYDDYLRLATEERDGTIIVTDYEPGIISADGVFNTRTDTPHSKTLKPIYEWLISEDVEFADLN